MVRDIEEVAGAQVGITLLVCGRDAAGLDFYLGSAAGRVY
jgi:hypothetical protein